MGPPMPKMIQGDTSLTLICSNYQSRQFYGNWQVEVFKKTSSLYAHIDLIGIEQYTKNNDEEIKHIFFKKKIIVEKIKKLKSNVEFFCDPDNMIDIDSNYSIIQLYKFSTVFLVECYLATTENATSKEGLINGRNLFVVRARKPRQQSAPIHLSYKPDIQDFHPQVNLQIDKNQFRIGENLRGLLAVDNTNANSQLIRNALTLNQVVEIMDKVSQQYTRLAQNKVSEQLLDTMGNEQKIFLIDINIHEYFQDAWSYDGVLYKIKYILSIEMWWENDTTHTLEQEIFIINDL